MARGVGLNLLLLQLVALQQSPVRGINWGWIPSPLDENHNLLAAWYEVPTSIGYVVGERDTILRTADGGATWSDFSSGLGSRYVWYGVSFWNSTLGWVVGSYGKTLNTKDGGVTWYHQETPVSYELVSDVSSYEITIHDVAAASPTVVYLVGDAGNAFRTTDGGASWITMDLETPYDLYSCFFYNTSLGWIVGGLQDRVRKTTDGGLTWSSHYVGLADSIGTSVAA
ncbi:hypothetical protein CYMTET_28163 [Cymbomonas tetramitiformis]|uniref:Photosynthesis system II assembly factor Ycf48/Hcf136-like domain-containing protein n=1 Tax=Cymbomonas tetramitiformis TaxID=36881 RepID=A0AAE0FNI9_9CHLO|nr:hypothetical protein CYMTET_28163 [Cymbomonas tetramitiformis]